MLLSEEMGGKFIDRLSFIDLSQRLPPSNPLSSVPEAGGAPFGFPPIMAHLLVYGPCLAQWFQDPLYLEVFSCARYGKRWRDLLEAISDMGVRTGNNALHPE